MAAAGLVSAAWVALAEEVLPPRATFDHLLLTAHLRVGATEAAARTAS